MTEITIHRVTWGAAREALCRVRSAVFVDEQGVPAELEIDEQDQWALHVLARNGGGEAVGTGRLLEDGHIGRLAVLPDWRGRGIGTRLLKELIATAEEIGMSEICLNAQLTAIPFYEKQGFDTEGDVFDDAGIPHRKMRYRR